MLISQTMATSSLIANFCPYNYAHNPNVKCNMLLNNISKRFNTFMKECRDKPMITMMEMIRRQLMRRMHLKKEGMKSYSQDVCPRIIAKLEVRKLDVRNCITEWGGNKTFKVRHCDCNLNVLSLIERTCTCL